MIYLLDTNICIYLLNQKLGYQKIMAKVDELNYETLGISSITLAELHYGIVKSVRKASNRTRLEYFLHHFKCLPFDEAATAQYGHIRAELESKGTPIGPLDTLIAAHGLSLNAIVVTHNVREFERVKGLEIENWLG